MIFKIVQDEADKTSYSIKFAHGYFQQFRNELAEAEQYGLKGKGKLSFAFRGFSDSEKAALSDYNKLLEQGVSSSDAMSQALSQTTQTARNAAIAANGNAVALKGESIAATMAAGATKLLYGALSMLGNIALTLVTTAIAKWLYDLAHAEEELQKVNQEAYEQINQQVRELNNQKKTLNDLIKKYNEYANITDLTIEQKKELKEIQAEYTEELGKEVDGLDLVNKKHEENLALMRKERAMKAEDSTNDYDEQLRTAIKTNSDNSAFGLNKTHDLIDPWKKLPQELLKQLREIGFSTTADYDSPDYVYVTLPSDTSYNMAEKLDEAYTIINKYIKNNPDAQIDDRILSNISKQKDEYREEYEKQYLPALYEKAQNIIEQYSMEIDGITYYFDNLIPEVYSKWYEGLLEYASQEKIEGIEYGIKKQLAKMNNDELFNAYLEYGDSYPAWLYRDDSKQFEESIVTFNSQYDELINNVRDKHSEYVSALEKLRDDPDADLTEFYQKNIDLAQFDSDRPRLISEIIKANTQAIDELANKLKTYRDNLPNEEDKAKVDAFLDTIEKWKYVDNIDEEVKRVVDDFTTLKETAAKLSSGDYEASDLQSLFEKYPELKQYSGDVDTLAKKTEELAETQATDLLLFLNTLKKTATDPEVIAGLNSQIAILEHLNFTTNSWLEYETAKIDDIVDGLEAENKKLQEQLDIVEDTISAYETASGTVQNYISDQIKALEDQKQAVEDSYDAQIKEIQDKNKEREQEINLQEKLDALLNAKKKRVSVYSETNGWKEQRNSSAIAEAQREYDQALDDKAIADLEKKRDAETSVFDDRIKAWNDYLDEWSDKMDKVKSISNEEKTAEVLGFDWRNRVNIQDKTLLDGLVNNYDIYLNKKKVQLDKEIADNSNRISLYQNLKDEMERSINGITTANNDYLNSLEKIAPAEIDSYEKRQAYLKSFLETQDKLLADSEYGSWLLGKKGATVDDPTIKGSQVIYDGANLLYQAITDKTLLRQKADERLKSATYGALADRNQLNRIKETYSSNNNYMFQFSGDIVTNDSEHFLAQIKQRLNLEKLQSKIGK